MSAQQAIRVAIVEDDRWLREMLAAELGKAKGFECAGTFRTAEEALEALPALRPDMVVQDINLPGMDGIECLRRLQAVLPETHFLMLTVYEESEKIFQSLLAGARGYLLKRAGTEEFFDALRQVRDGGSPMSSSIARRVVRYFNQMGAGTPELGRLSPREREVLELLARGHAYKGIADELSLSIETVRMNVKRIYAKLHVNSRGEAVAKYLRHGQTPPPG